MDDYLAIYHKHFEGFETDYFDSRTVTRDQAFDLLESLSEYYAHHSLPNKPPGEHWPHIGEVIYPVRSAGAWHDLGIPRRAEQVTKSFDTYYLPEVHRALLFSHGVVLWDPVYRELCVMRAGGPHGEQAFRSLTRDKLMTVQDLADPIRHGLIRMAPYQDVTACLDDFLSRIGVSGSGPERFVRTLEEIRQQLPELEAQRVAFFLQYHAGWVGYRLKLDRKFDLVAQFRDDLAGLEYTLNKTGGAFNQAPVSTLRLLTSGCQFDPSSTVSISDLLKIREQEDVFVEWRDLIEQTLESFMSADVIDSRELCEQFEQARARAGSNFQRAKRKSPRIRRMLSACGNVGLYGVSGAAISTLFSQGTSSPLVAGLTAAAQEGVNQVRQGTTESHALERAKRHHIMVLERGE